MTSKLSMHEVVIFPNTNLYPEFLVSSERFPPDDQRRLAERHHEPLPHGRGVRGDLALGGEQPARTGSFRLCLLCQASGPGGRPRGSRT